MDRMEAAMDDKFSVLEQMYKESQLQVDPSPSVPSSPLTPSQVYARSVRALVSVYARYEGPQGYGGSVGSGFLITADGYIVQTAPIWKVFPKTGIDYWRIAIFDKEEK
jgi:hypothetical protein